MDHFYESDSACPLSVVLRQQFPISCHPAEETTSCSHRHTSWSRFKNVLVSAPYVLNLALIRLMHINKAKGAKLRNCMKTD